MKGGMPGGRRGAGFMGVEGNCSGLCFEVIGNCGAAAASLLVVLELLGCCGAAAAPLVHESEPLECVLEVLEVGVMLSSRGDARGAAACGGIAAADAAVLTAAVLFAPAAAGCGSC